MKVFLIFNTACFGDNLVCNALCQNIKRIFPDSKVVFVVDKPFYEAAKYQKCVDDVIIYDKKFTHKGIVGLTRFVKEFPYKGAYASFITYRNLRNLWVSYLVGVKHIYQNGKLKDDTPTQLQILNLLQGLTKETLKNIPITYESPNCSKFDKYFESDRNCIALCTLTKNPTKDIPLKTAVGIIKTLSPKYKIIYTGVGNVAEEYAKALCDCGLEFINLVNKTSVAELADVLRKCKALISADTGTMHLGCAVGIPIVAVFYENNTLGKWAPDRELYKSVLISEEQTPQNICAQTLNLIGDFNE